MSNSASDYAIVAAAAKLYGISADTLWGMYGTESGYGANNGPSSAGALGPFQFMPGTAKQYGVNVNSLQSSALGAARYMHDLGADANPDSAATAAALNKYSGGGGASYVAKVKENAKRKPGSKSDGGGLIPGFPDPGDIHIPNPLDIHIPNPLGGVTDALTAPVEGLTEIAHVFTALTKPDTWFRLGKGVMGFVLINIGVAALVFVVANKASNGQAGQQIKSVATTAVTKGAVK